MAECGKGCKHWPPSSADGKPCCYCDTSNPLMNCYAPKGTKGRPKKTETMKEQFRVRLTPKQKEQLKSLAAKNGLSESAMLRKLVVEAFERS